MYSRYKRIEYDRSDEDEITDVSDDEYELYRYNLPPRYDGSRFSRRTVPCKKAEDIIDSPTNPSEECSALAEDVRESPPSTEEPHEKPAITLPGLSTRGYEDVLIISLILLIAEKGDSTGDVILLLTLLLAAK